MIEVMENGNNMLDTLNEVTELQRKWLDKAREDYLNAQKVFEKWKKTHPVTTKEFKIAWAYARNRIPMGSAQLNRLKEKMTKDEKKFLGLK